MEYFDLAFEYDNQVGLTVAFDDRISEGTLSMPGLPGQSGVGPDKYGVTYWHRIAAR